MDNCGGSINTSLAFLPSLRNAQQKPEGAVFKAVLIRLEKSHRSLNLPFTPALVYCS